MELREVLTGYKENLSNMRIVKKWNMLPREVMHSPFLEVFKTRLDKTLRTLSNFIVEFDLNRQLEKLIA